jgi:RNA polymerase sigma-70 factor (ECF subfamily)
MEVGAQRSGAPGDGPEPLTDDELVWKFRSTKDAVFFAELFARHRKKVYWSCRRFYGEGSAAEDATQEAFLKAFQNVGRYAGGDFCSWLMRISRNVCIDQWRKRKTEGGRDDEREMDQLPSRQLADPESEASLVAERVQQEMKQLPEAQRQCLALKIEGYSYEETAMKTGMSVPAVKSHLQNGRRALWMRIEGTVKRMGS